MNKNTLSLLLLFLVALNAFSVGNNKKELKQVDWLKSENWISSQEQKINFRGGSIQDDAYFTAITLPFDSLNVTFDTLTNVIDLTSPYFGTYPGVGYKFTLAKDTTLDLSFLSANINQYLFVISDSPALDSIIYQNMGSGTTDTLLAGTYYLALLTNDQFGSYNIYIEESSQKAHNYETVSIPFKQNNIPFGVNDASITSTPMGTYPGLTYQFTLSNDTSLSISAITAIDAYFYFSNDSTLNINSIISEGYTTYNLPLVTSKLSAGTYYFTIITNNSFGVIDMNIKTLADEVSYHKIDYSEIINVGETKYGKFNRDNNPLVNSEEWMGWANGYSVNLEKDKTYNFTLKSFASDTTTLESAITILTDDPFNGSFNTFNGDKLAFNGNGESDILEQTLELTFTPDSTGIYRILAQNYIYIDEVLFSLNIQEVPAIIPSDPSPITVDSLLNKAIEVYYSTGLPYTNSGYFGQAPTSLTIGDDVFGASGNNYYAQAYKLMLNAGDSINVKNEVMEDAFLYLYGVGNSGYELMIVNDDDGYSSNSEISFKADSTGYYYFIATTFNANTVSNYTISIENPIQVISDIIIEDITTNIDSITVDAGISESDLRILLSEITITPTVQMGQTIPTLANNPYAWTISGDLSSASLTFTAPTGYAFDAGIGIITISIGVITPTTISTANSAKIYAADKAIVVKDATEGESITILSINGNTIYNGSVSSTSEKIAIANSGIYLVLVNNKATKVIVK